MVTLVSGQISCTALAIICAQSCLISSKATFSFLVVNTSNLQFKFISLERSDKIPSIEHAIAAFFKELEMLSAT